MKIGVDIDGVLTDVGRFQLDYGSKYCFENNTLDVINPNEYKQSAMFNLDREEEKGFWDNNIEHYMGNTKIRDFASEIINKLKEEQHEIYILTARNNEVSWFPEEFKLRVEEVTKGWLSKNNVYYDNIIFAKGNKLEYCMEYGIDLMIEDKTSNVEDISKYIPVICFDSEYNRDAMGENVYRCYSWYDVYHRIKEIGEKKIWQ